MWSWMSVLMSLLTISALSASSLKVPPLNYCYTEDVCSPYNWVKMFPTCLTQHSVLHSPINLEPVAIKNDSIDPLELRGFSVHQRSWTVVNVRDTGLYELCEYAWSLTLRDRESYLTKLTVTDRSGLADPYTIRDWKEDWTGLPKVEWPDVDTYLIETQIVVKFDPGMAVKGGSIKHNYRIIEMRFHWGSNTSNGSEHKFNNRRFPMEMQIVGLAPEFTDMEAASAVQSGLLMIGVFIDISSSENKAFRVISRAVHGVPHPGDSVTVTSPPALSYLLPNDYKFYQYHGGQTTPPCLQTVTWIVFEKPIFISRQQHLPFITSLYYSDKNDPVKKMLVKNFRATQPSLNRQVFVSSAVKICSASSGALSQHALFIPFLILLVCLK